MFIDMETITRMTRELKALREEFAKVPPDREVSADGLTTAIRLSREADTVLKRANAAGQSVPIVVHQIREFMLANEMPTTLKPGESVGRACERMSDLIASSESVERALAQSHNVPRTAVLDLMREHWQDPAGFHEALALLLGVEEKEYAPSFRYTLGPDVIDAATRVADYVAHAPGAQLFRNTPVYDDIKLVADALANAAGEEIDE